MYGIYAVEQMSHTGTWEELDIYATYEQALDKSADLIEDGESDIRIRDIRD